MAATAPPAARARHAIGGLDQVREQVTRLGIPDDGSRRDGDQEIIGALALLVAALTVRTAPGFEMGAFFKSEESIEPRVDDQDNVSAFAAMPAIRSSVRDELFPPKAHDAIAAVACLHKDLCLVKK